MINLRKAFSKILVVLLMAFTLFGDMPAKAAKVIATIPQIQFATAPVTEYTVGDRVGFNINAPNYSGKVEYRVVLWNDVKKTYYDLWNSGNGYPNRYYTKWQPKGNDIFTLGWIISEPGSYRITVYAKRVGVPNNMTALKGINCDSYMESVAFVVKPKGNSIVSLQSLSDIVINQGSTPILPSAVKANMSDGTQKDVRVNWGYVDTSRMGTFILEGSVEGTSLKAAVRLTVNQGTFNVLSVYATSNMLIRVRLTEEIAFIPNSIRFSVKGIDTYPISVKVINLLADKKSIELTTDYLVSGYYYSLSIDNKDYGFVVPMPGEGAIYPTTVSVNALERIVGVGESIISKVTTTPLDATLSFISSDPSIVSINRQTGVITGISAGTATIAVTAKSSGYNTGWALFTVRVTTQSQQVSEIAAYPAPGNVHEGTQVILTTPIIGGNIYYTLDGTTPTIYSRLYTVPITINYDTTIRAVVVKSGAYVSSVATMNYFIGVSETSSRVWLIDKSASNTNYKFSNWAGPYEVELNKTSDNRRVINLYGVQARKILTDERVSYSRITLTETYEGSYLFTSNVWDGDFILEEFWNGSEHSVKFSDGYSVDIRLFNSLDQYPVYVRNWFFHIN